MNRPRPSIALAALLTTLVALGPLSTDLYLPALPTLVRVFACSPAQVQLTLSVFLVGFACGQVVYGPLSDRFGRRPVLLSGLALYCLGSLGCVLSTSIETLVAARFVQALGACAGPVIGRAVVRDVWGASESARIIAYMGGAMALAPLVGPTIGGLLTVWLGWQSNFVLLLLIGVVQFAAVGRTLDESNDHCDPQATRPSRMIAGFARLLSDRAYLACLLCLAFSYSALFAFISGSSFVLAGRHGLGPIAFGACFGLVVAGYLFGSVTSGRLVRQIGSASLLNCGAWLGALAGAGIAGLEFAGVRELWALLGPMFVCATATGLVMPNAISRALAPYPAMAGSASALLGVVQMSVAALVGVAVGQGLSDGGHTLAVAVAACTLLAAFSYQLLGGRPVVT